MNNRNIQEDQNFWIERLGSWGSENDEPLRNLDLILNIEEVVLLYISS